MKHYAISDLHGNYDLWCVVKNYLKADDYLYCLGDCIDRGKNGIKILQDMQNLNNTTLILGNHEEMMLKYAKVSLQYKEIPTWWYYNGGGPTFKTFMKLSKTEQENLLNYLKGCPLKVTYDNKKGQEIILCHAGFTPGRELEAEYRYRRENTSHLLWDRDHFEDYFNDEDAEDYFDTFVVFGHTPVDYLYSKEKIAKEGYKVHTSAKGHKIDIDLGAVWSDTTCLLDLDTLKPIYFNLEGVISEDGRKVN